MAFLKSLHARYQLMEVNFVSLLFGPEKLSKNEAIFCFIFTICHFEDIYWIRLREASPISTRTGAYHDIR